MRSPVDTCPLIYRSECGCSRRRRSLGQRNNYMPHLYAHTHVLHLLTLSTLQTAPAGRPRGWVGLSLTTCLAYFCSARSRASEGTLLEIMLVSTASGDSREAILSGGSINEGLMRMASIDQIGRSSDLALVRIASFYHSILLCSIRNFQ